MDKIVKTRKVHKCAYCEKEIPRGVYATLSKGRCAKFDDSDVQIGVVFYTAYYHEKTSTCEQFMTPPADGMPF